MNYYNIFPLNLLDSGFCPQVRIGSNEAINVEDGGRKSNSYTCANIRHLVISGDVIK